MKKFLLVAIFLLLFIVLPAVGLGIVFPAYSVLAFFVIGLVVFISVLAVSLGMRSQSRSNKKTKLQPDGKTVDTKLALDPQRLASLYEEIRAHQVTSGGEIIHSIDGSAIISRDLLMTSSHMKTFNERMFLVAETVRSIGQSLDSLNQGVQTVAETSEQTATSVEQMSASIDLISQISADRYKELKDVVDLAQRGQGEMSATVNVMREVTGGIGDLQGFIEVIDDIAGRTSILSMNAAIQAAHAGESGRGFAVVADEIRKLANSSAKNASNIAQRLKDLIEDIRKAETSSNATSQFFSTTKESAERLSDSFSEIERGTQELAVSGRNILNSVISLRESSGVIRTSSAQVVETSGGLKSSVDKSQSDSQSLLDQMNNVRKVAVEINFNGLTVAQNNLSGLKFFFKESSQTSVDSDLQKVNLLLQHKSLIARVRAALDGKMKLDPQVISDAQACELGRWLGTEGQGNESLLTEHEKLHQLAGSAITHLLEGRVTKAEEDFSHLLEISQSLIDLLNDAFSQ